MRVVVQANKANFKEHLMSEAPLPKKTIEVLGRKMAFHQSGEGNPILMFHGNPTSSYIWRDVIPSLRELGKVIAPDLIGMGDSEKLPDAGPSTYTFQEHRKYLWAFIDDVLSAGEKPILVVHDWGSALGFD